MLDLDTSIGVHDGSLVVGRSQDCDPISEHAKKLAAHGMVGSSDMKYAASIPFVMVEKYCNDKNITFAEWSGNKEHIRNMLNDPALAHFRIWKGNV